MIVTLHSKNAESHILENLEFWWTRTFLHLKMTVPVLFPKHKRWFNVRLVCVFGNRRGRPCYARGVSSILWGRAKVFHAEIACIPCCSLYLYWIGFPPPFQEFSKTNINGRRNHSYSKQLQWKCQSKRDSCIRYVSHCFRLGKMNFSEMNVVFTETNDMHTHGAYWLW